MGRDRRGTVSTREKKTIGPCPRHEPLENRGLIPFRSVQTFKVYEVDLVSIALIALAIGAVWVVVARRRRLGVVITIVATVLIVVIAAAIVWTFLPPRVAIPPANCHGLEPEKCQEVVEAAVALMEPEVDRVVVTVGRGRDDGHYQVVGCYEFSATVVDVLLGDIGEPRASVRTFGPNLGGMCSDPGR